MQASPPPEIMVFHELPASPACFRTLTTTRPERATEPGQLHQRYWLRFEEILFRDCRLALPSLSLALLLLPFTLAVLTVSHTI